jgi:selenocysteine lyase/cysteine desulfurase
MNWASWRAEFPSATRITHFNHAGVSPISQRVAAATRVFADQALLLDAAVQRAWEVRTDEIRGACGRLIGARADEIAFVKNTSEGLSLVAAGLDWRAGDSVIAVEGEYPANVYPWWSLRRWGVKTRMLQPRRGLVQVDDIAALADASTRLVAVSFVDWSSGARNDLEAIAGGAAVTMSSLCVDGIQGRRSSPDVERAGIDFSRSAATNGCWRRKDAAALLAAGDRTRPIGAAWLEERRRPGTYLPYHFDPRPDAGKFELAVRRR